MYFCTAKILSAVFFPAHLAGFYTKYCKYFCFLAVFHSDTIGHNIDLWKSEMLLEVSNGRSVQWSVNNKEKVVKHETNVIKLKSAIYHLI